MNKLIKREFLAKKIETQKYKNRNGDQVTSGVRKRWYATMVCQECNDTFSVWEKPKGVHLERPCEKCSKRILAYKNFIRKATDKHGAKFDYSKVTKDNYVNLFTPVMIGCSRHGTFLQKPKDHTSKTNAKLCCPDCIYEFNKIHNKRTIRSWKEELDERFPGFKMVKHGNADTNTEKCTIECPEHGEFVTPLASIKNSKYLCPYCAQDHNSWGGRFRRTDVGGTLYFVYLPTLGLWKLGVTSASVAKRLRNLKLDYEVLWEQEFSTLAEAYRQETFLFKQYKDFRRCRTLPNVLGKCKGSTELMTCNIPNTAIQGSNALSKEP